MRQDEVVQRGVKPAPAGAAGGGPPAPADRKLQILKSTSQYIETGDKYQWRGHNSVVARRLGVRGTAIALCRSCWSSSAGLSVFFPAGFSGLNVSFLVLLVLLLLVEIGGHTVWLQQFKSLLNGGGARAEIESRLGLPHEVLDSLSTPYT